ncbi:unnamed protein product [Moneuplotes crassus]|uniref:Uncharacterized protein n=1 Tax=Euplotes crassus TaxID=5936 RepID=A0AAD1XIG5_EUPCR|nr:unnamed protein product [Moneuplotes crassus]
MPISILMITTHLYTPTLVRKFLKVYEMHSSSNISFQKFQNEYLVRILTKIIHFYPKLSINIDGSLEFSTIPNLRTKISAYIQKNEVEVQDSYFSYQPGGSTQEFIAIDKTEQRIESINKGKLQENTPRMQLCWANFENIDNSNDVFKIRFIKDNYSKSFGRSVFTFMEATGNIGGLFEILEIAGGFLVGIFSGRLFLYSLLSQLYQIEDQTTLNSATKESTENKLELFSKSEDLNIKDSSFANNTGYQSNNIKDKASRSMRNRLRYDWKISDYLFNLINFISFTFCCCFKDKSKLHAKTRLKLYRRGEQKYIKEFDAVGYAKSMRAMSTLINSLMDEKEKFMLAYQKINTIPTENESDTSDSEDAYSKVPSLFSNEAKRAEHKHKVEKFMADYSREKWSGRDFRLLNGVYSKYRLKETQVEYFKNEENIEDIEKELEKSAINSTVKFAKILPYECVHPPQSFIGRCKRILRRIWKKICRRICKMILKMI